MLYTVPASASAYFLLILHLVGMIVQLGHKPC